MAAVQSTIYPYLGEFHCNDKRKRALFITTAFQPLTSIFLSSLAWLITSMDWEWRWSENFAITPWRVFLLSTNIIHIITLILLFKLPQSPKFLLIKDRKEKALDVLRNMYTINTRQNPEVRGICDFI